LQQQLDFTISLLRLQHKYINAKLFGAPAVPLVIVQEILILHDKAEAEMCFKAKLKY
jgi:hypothetical protein